MVEFGSLLIFDTAEIGAVFALDNVPVSYEKCFHKRLKCCEVWQFLVDVAQIRNDDSELGSHVKMKS
jgi:hypothetical protein